MSKKKEKEVHYATFRYSCGHELESSFGASYEGETYTIKRLCPYCLGKEQEKRMLEYQFTKLATTIREAIASSNCTLYGVPFTKEELEVLALFLMN